MTLVFHEPPRLGAMRAIVKICQDDHGHWLAITECGHGQRIRHRPPNVNNHWVLSEAGRARRIGRQIKCRECGE